MNSNNINYQIDTGIWVDGGMLRNHEKTENEHILHMDHVNYYMIGDNYICGYWDLEHLNPNNLYRYRDGYYVLCEYSGEWSVKDAHLTDNNLIIILRKD